MLSLTSIRRIILDRYVVSRCIDVPDYRLIPVGIMFKFSPSQFAYPEKKLTINEMLAKFINEGIREHEEIEIFIREFRTTKGAFIKGAKQLIKINEANDNHNEPSGFQRDEQEKPQEVIVENESSKVQERT
ncbi:hypothetical protein Tco_0836002 [Tanacetum coccineum]